ncbi:superoxide dismutase [Malassezia psittaci]|uniref:Superoxide dismutase n=1 Tax=Malassezia psittaci TaxID=1821823 RepID=A0AAF0F2B3_9BASI|nr:superoxide dismutase [Malassezia psittaci]
MMQQLWTSPVRVALRMPFRRQLHQLPPIASEVEQGCTPFLSKRTTNLLWTQWQAGLLQRLNEETKASESVVDTVIATARDRSQVLAFNYASLALNNSFFLHGLLPKDKQPNPEYPQPSTHTGTIPTFYGKTLASAIADQYGSLPQFKLAFASAAMGSVNNGFVWLVKDEHGRLGIIPTYGAGTILVQQRRQTGPRDLTAGIQDGRMSAESSTEPQNDSDPSKNSEKDEAPRHSTRFDSLAQSSATGAIGNHIYPLFCVSMFEHAWLGDYGFWGKERYLTNFFDCINWERAEQLWGEDRV